MRRTLMAAAGIGQWASAVALAVGAGVLVGMSIAASREANGAISVVDGYWLGPLPWTSIGVGLMLFGPTACVLTTATSMWLGVGWIGRALAVPPMLSVAFWWATAAMLGSGGACCFPPSAFDPITIAYSAPIWTLSLVVLPAVALAAIDWLGRPRPTTVAGPSFRTVSGA